MRLRRRDKKDNYRSGSILVHGGMDIKKTITGSGKGDYFNRNAEEADTYMVAKGKSAVWKIAFQNLATGEVYKYRFRQKMWIGRAGGNTSEVFLALPQDGKVSKVHCTVYEWENCLVLADANSTNHTWLNGRRADKPAVLKNGDVIKVGDTQMRVEYGK